MVNILPHLNFWMQEGVGVWSGGCRSVLASGPGGYRRVLASGPGGCRRVSASGPGGLKKGIGVSMFGVQEECLCLQHLSHLL